FAPWCEEFLKVERTDGAAVPMRPETRLHSWLSDELQGMVRRRGTRQNVLAPRGSAKSTWASYAYPLWCAAWHHESYIVIASDSYSQAAQFLRNIRGQLETNDDLIATHPGLARGGGSWREDFIELANGVRIQAVGTGGRIRGRVSGRV